MDDRAQARLERRLDRLERTLRDIEVDIATIIRELRVKLLPHLLPPKSGWASQRRPLLNEEDRKTLFKRNAQNARAAKPVGVGKGAVRDPAVKRRLRREAGEL